MKYLVRKEEMKRYDANTTAYFGIPSMVLIERAALAAVEELAGMGICTGRHTRGFLGTAVGTAETAEHGTVCDRNSQ